MVFDALGGVVASHQLEHTQLYPQPGWVEHDAEEIWARVAECAREALNAANLSPGDLAALGITNQRETTVVWNRHTGKPYHNAIVWNDTRTSELCDRLTSTLVGGKDTFRNKTGLPIATYFSASKLMYLLDTVSGLRESAEKGDALFGTIDSWLIFKLTCGKVHATDVTNASRTMLMNLETLQWDEEVLATLKIPKAMLPEIRSSSEVYGKVLSIPGLTAVPIAGVLGDQHAALFGQTCFETGDAKCTYGTGAFLLLNTGHRKVKSTSGLLTTVGYQLGPGQPVTYALEGSVAYCGSLVQWLRDNLEIIGTVQESESLAAADNGGVYFVPAFSGLYAPYWRSDARGIIMGLTAFNTRAHIARAALEAAAFQAKEVLDAMEKDSAVRLKSLRVDGGMTRNNAVMQFQCDLVDVPLHCPKIPEMTALGAAYVAGLAVGLWTSLDDLRGAWQAERSWNPKMGKERRRELVLHWRKALARTLDWSKADPEDDAHLAVAFAPSAPASASAAPAPTPDKTYLLLGLGLAGGFALAAAVFGGARRRL
jgi:glycerol kinase